MSRPDSNAKSEIAAWYVSRGGDATGPFSTDMLLAMLRNSQLQPLDLVFREGEVEWKPVATFRELKISKAPASTASGSASGAGSARPSANQSAPISMPPSSGPPSSVPASPSNLGPAVMGKNDPRALSWIVLRPHNSTYLQEGPLETQAIIEGLEKGQFQFSQYAWHAGMNQWMRIGDLREFDRRSRSRESKPHVPPPLPDPIAAVMLEDDGDSDAEVFHVSLRGNLKHDLTPNPLESMQAITLLGNAAIGGAAAESPEQKASRAVSLVVSPGISSGNLAGVPWEQDASDGYAQAVELIDDQHSGIHAADLFADDGPDQFTFTGSIGVPSATGTNAKAPPPVSPAELEHRFELTPLPGAATSIPAIIPGVPTPLVNDRWNKWGRYVAGGGMLILFFIFSWHLATQESSWTHAKKGALALASHVAALAPAPAVPAPVAPAPMVAAAGDTTGVDAGPAETVPMLGLTTPNDDFGKDAPDFGLPSAREVSKKPTPALKVAAKVEVALPPMTASNVAPIVSPATAVPVSPATAVAPISASTTAASPISAPPIVPASLAKSKELGVVGLKLDRPEGVIVIRGPLPPNAPITVTFKGRLGQILSKLSVRKTVTVPRKGSEVPTLKVRNLRLPTGAYTVEVKVAEASAKNELFIGARDAKFLDHLESHLRDVSLETQTQKKILFYASQELNVLARDLGQNYGQLRDKPELWTAFSAKWKQRMEMVARSIEDVTRKAVESQAYPEETASLLVAQTNLKEVANQFEQAIGQRRDMASDVLTDLISELTRQKESLGQLTARPSSEHGKP